MGTLKQAFLIFAVLSLLTGVVYPLAITFIAQTVFAEQANGSLIIDQKTKQILGSAVLGQEFKSDKYFWSRPSATSPFPYNSGASCGSNLGPTNTDLLAAVEERVALVRSAHGNSSKVIPVDLVTSSSSGLDPDITPASAEYQVERVARVRGLSPSEVCEMIRSSTNGRQLGFLGEERVNVVKLNLLLDKKRQ